MTDEKVTENRMRRVAARRGLELQKSRTRDPNALDFGGYMLIEIERNLVVLGGGDRRGYRASLQDVIDYLDAPKAKIAKKPKATKRKK
jgi:hypothetical protein